MTAPQHSASASDRVRAIAENYRSWGYQVIVNPGTDVLPAFLGSYRPDLLARQGEENVLVEVRTEAHADEAERYHDLSSRVQEHPGWRFDLVVLEGTSQAMPATDLPVLSAEQIEQRYVEADRISTSGYEDAALLLAWAATEAALRLLAQRYAVPAQRADTPLLLKHLVSLGVIGRDDYDRLWTLYRARNAVAHGFASRQPAGSAASIISIGRRMLAEDREAA